MTAPKTLYDKIWDAHLVDGGVARAGGVLVHPQPLPGGVEAGERRAVLASGRQQPGALRGADGGVPAPVGAGAEVVVTPNTDESTPPFALRSVWN